MADSMNEWEGKVAEELKLTKTEVDLAAIKIQYPMQLNLQTRAALEKWQVKCGSMATYRSLITVFVRADKGDFAEAVCKVLSEKCTQHKDEGLQLCTPKTKISKPTSRYASYLKGVYEHASDEKVPKVSCEKFIDLALVKRTRISRPRADKFTRATLHGNIDEILRDKEPIKMEDILKPKAGQPAVKCVLVQGAPGIGKSTFALEFCRRLREKRVQHIRNVGDLFYHYDADLQHNVFLVKHQK